MLQKITKTLKSNVQDVNEAKGIVTIQITQFDKYDSDNDRLLKGALTKTWNEGQQVHLVDHKMGTSTYVGLPLSKDAEKGIIESQLNLNKQVAKDLLEDYIFSQKHGRSLQHSHGFLAVKDKYEKNEKGGYDFAEVKQYEYSTVIFGAVPDTPLHSIKSNTTIEDLIDELKLKLATCNYSNEYGKLIELKIIELKSMIIEPSNHSNQQTDPLLGSQKRYFIY
jgi:HK97 family phage prohead protease